METNDTEQFEQFETVNTESTAYESKYAALLTPAVGNVACHGAATPGAPNELWR